MTKLLETLPFWDKLSENEKDLCRSSASINKFSAGTYLLSNCTENGCRGLIHVLSGKIRAFLLSEEGREITLFHIGEGENCVLSASCVLSQITFKTEMLVTEDAEILQIPSPIFAILMENNIFVKCYAYELATTRFSSVVFVMQQILFFGFDKRLAHFLITEYERTGNKEILMTQEEIAEATNSAREVVARMLKQFTSDALIEYKRGSITLKNIKALKDL